MHTAPLRTPGLRWASGRPRTLPPWRLEEDPLQAAGEGNRLGSDLRGSDLKLDLCVRVEGDVAGVARVALAVIDRDNTAGGRAQLMRPKGLAPLVEEVAQGVGAPDRGLDVNDAVGGMGEQPEEAGTAGD